MSGRERGERISTLTEQLDAVKAENDKLRAALAQVTGSDAAFDLLKRIVDKLKVAMPILDSFVTLLAIRSNNPNIYNGPSLEQELKDADALIAARALAPAKEQP
jgi:trans-2-enoyl-CoA reductase